MSPYEYSIPKSLLTSDLKDDLKWGLLEAEKFCLFVCLFLRLLKALGSNLESWCHLPGDKNVCYLLE